MRLGVYWAFSQEIHVRVGTPTKAAMAACVKPRSFRRARSRAAQEPGGGADAGFFGRFAMLRIVPPPYRPLNHYSALP